MSWKFLHRRRERESYKFPISNFQFPINVPKRLQRVNQLIKKELSQILLREIEFPPEVLATVTRVESAPNLIEAKVFISVMPEEKTPEVLGILNQRIYELQQKINKRLKMRPVPQIKFVGERKTSEAGRIEEILEELKKREK